jgi:hypothetical protein
VHVYKISHPQEEWSIEKNLFSTRGYAEIHIQRPFFDNKNSMKKSWKKSWIENPNGGNMF